MQLSLKSLVAASLLTVASTGAMAAVVPLPSTGNGDASLTIVNTQLNTSVIIDLDRTLESLLPSVLTPESGLSFTINLGSEVAAFMGGSSASSYSWWVAAADSLGNGNNADRRILTTGAVGSTANISNSFVRQAADAQNNFLTTVNGTAGCTSGPNCFGDPSSAAYGGSRPSGFEWDTRWNNNLNAGLQNGTVGLGSVQGFYLYASAENGFQSAARTAYANSAGAATWLLELVDGQALLTYNVAAVPLPAAVWLLLSGLMGLGVISRRRNKA